MSNFRLAQFAATEGQQFTDRSLTNWVEPVINPHWQDVVAWTIRLKGWLTTYRVALLGEPSLEGPDGPIPISVRKGQALLWYCASQPQRKVRRADLASLLWGPPTRSGLDSLSTTLVRLRRALPVWPLHAEADWVSWNRDCGVQVDLHRFRAALSDADDNGGDAALLSEALSLYRGPFLQGFDLPGLAEFGAWIHHERRQLALDVLRGVRLLIGMQERLQDWQGVAKTARRGLDIDPLQEDLHRSLILAYHRQGNRAAALTYLRAYQDAVAKESGAAPSSALLELTDIVERGRDLPSAYAQTREEAVPWPPLVGREDALQALLGDQGLGRGICVAVCGEAGVGKTRLIKEIVSRKRAGMVARSARTVLLGHCHEDSGRLPLAPFAEALRSYPDLQALVREGSLDDVWLAEVGRLLPELRPDLRPLPSADAGEGRRRLYEGISRLLAVLPAPVLLVLEDVHWADGASTSLLGHLARHRPPGLAVLLTLRAGEEPQRVRQLLGNLEREGILLRHDLSALSREATITLVKILAGTSDQGLGERLYAMSEGLPLFVLEFVRSLRESGDATEARHSVDTLGTPMPATVQHVVRTRLARLSREGRAILAACSLFPRPVPFEVLRRVVQLQDEEVVAALEPVIAAGLVREQVDRGGRAPVAGLKIGFTHDVIRRVVHDDLLETRNQLLHRRAFQALRETAGDFYVVDLALHATEGGLWEEAFRWNERAAEVAEGLYDRAEAVRFLKVALLCLEHLPSTPDLGDRKRDILLRLARDSRVVDFAAGSAVVEQAADAEGTPKEKRLHLQLERAFNFVLQGRSRLAAELLEQCLPETRAAGLRDLEALGLSYTGVLRMSLEGDFEGSRALLEEAWRIDTEQGHCGDLYATLAPAVLVSVRTAMGDLAGVDEVYREIRARSEQSGDPMLRALVMSQVARAALIRGDAQEGLEAAREGARLSRSNGSTLFRFMCEVDLGTAMTALGEPEGINVLEGAIESAVTNRLRLTLGRAYAALADARLRAGQLDLALQAAETGLSVAEHDEALADAALNRLQLARIEAATGRRDLAREKAEAALAQFAASGARPSMVRCHLLLAELANGEAELLGHERAAEELHASMGLETPMPAACSETSDKQS